MFWAFVVVDWGVGCRGIGGGEMEDKERLVQLIQLTQSIQKSK